MSRPTVHPTTDIVYAGIGSGARHDDAAAGYPLLRFIDALVLAGVALVDDATRGEGGWRDLLDPDEAPGYALGWLSRFAGVRLPVGLDEAAQRARIKDAPAQRRGTPAAIRAVAQETLTSGQTLTFVERAGTTGTVDDAYIVEVRTFAAETPDATATEAAVAAVLPAGLQLVYAELTGATYDQLTAEFATYADLTAAFGVYNEMIGHVPAI